MLPLPLPDPLGVFLVAEIILVIRDCQPTRLVGSFPGFLTIDLGTESLPRPVPVIGKKKSLAVKAFTAAGRSLHRFENQTDQPEEHSDEQRRKSRQEENSEQRRRNKIFQ
jgi:hypothetical protein